MMSLLKITHSSALRADHQFLDGSFRCPAVLIAGVPMAGSGRYYPFPIWM